jgi:hypothetical protein
MRETEVWDRVTDTVYVVTFTTDEDGVNMERVVVGDDDGGDVDVTFDLDFDTAERLRDVIVQRVFDGGML